MGRFVNVKITLRHKILVGQTFIRKGNISFLTHSKSFQILSMLTKD